MKKVEVYDYNLPGYAKLFSYQEWRIAMLNYINHLEVEKINYCEAHEATDEVFVLLEGECTIILMEYNYPDSSNKFILIEMEKNKIYNIPKGTFHNHVLSLDAKVLIIEQEDTSDDNSVRVYFDSNDQNELLRKWRSAK
ncbi:MAG: hypothetical protein RBQ97_02540 [Acholeplasma sp.]|nr:hypothetical protein [Acholeplasma sp.]